MIAETRVTDQSGGATVPRMADTGNDDVKRKFREALERKNEKNKNAENHLDGRSKVGGVHTRADHKREFRRKSG